MDVKVLLAIAAVALLVVLALAWMLRRRRSTHLRQRFGPEYTQVVHEHKDQRAAEQVLEQRERRVATFHIRPLAAADATGFAERWRRTQTEFVDDPRGAVTSADRLVAEVLEARGYPMGDFEQRAADISVDHPAVVSNYRAARVIAERQEGGEATTEDLRQALVHYRALFDDLLDIGEEPLRRAAGGRR